MTTTPRVLGGRYEVGALIGRGGMADVHLGHDTRLGRQVAIKMLRSDLARDTNFLMRFRREAQSAAGLNHPAIVAIFDSGEDETLIEGPHGTHTTLPYIVMEYVDGQTLRQQLSTHQQLPPAEAIRITEGILDALAYSHRMGIVHRDIKPANVMITSSGNVKVMDFGIARAIADTAATMTQTQSVVGTAQYLSPEQAQGQTVDARSDLYSTGCLLFELLTGRPPFQGDSPVAIAYQHVGETPQPPSVYNPVVGGDLDAVTLHALAKDRDARYQDADSFREDLENVRFGRPISAAALGAGVAVGAAATQTMPAPYSAAGTPTAVQPTLTSRRQRHENTAGLPAVGHDEDEDLERRGRGGRAALITLLVLAVLGLIGWGAVTWFGNQDPPVATTTVPDLRGMDEAAVERALATYKLQGERSEGPSEVEAGKVFEQSPEPGLEVDEGTVVRYTVSTGPESITVPDVRNFDREDAEKAMEDAGFTNVVVEERDDPNTGKDKVIETDPAIGTAVGRDTKITIIVASGQVVVPEGQVGRDWSLAANTLADAGLDPKRVDVESDEAPGTVVSVEKEGERVDVGSEITVEVAKATAPPPTTTTVTTTATVTQPPPTTTTETTTTEPPDDGGGGGQG
ncbi:Stk1 family PASTA domain-containing Ser/Thr kinase [Intrasporangium sp.]|uniref:Stk1 family PASTA domain-containing Ser/Thr kinase n=1 Tax=Intrasporangium sp. TaxID=1925024 RepID=UPI00293AA5E0|nr:Stk1 family PASTA domain-containing Ser/Thr kinase [Intrasporangium sp.]MDV3221483.1 Stk1 family PASTA domain-containing Ser/Thr kinase [Intrasporangium sp.]